MSEMCDPLTIKTGLTKEKRIERARKAGEGSNTVQSYVRRIVKNAPDLTPEDLESLRALVAPVTDPEIYVLGVKAGAQLAVERIVTAVESLTGDNPIPVR